MKTDDRNMLPITTIPITDPSVAMLAWEVFELCENLKDLLELSSASQHEGSLEAHQAAGSFACWTGYIADQAVSYHRSIQLILSKRDLSCPEGLDELEALALRFKANDKLVCHVAMFKCYMALNAALAPFEADKFRTGCIERTYCVVEAWVLQRMRVEKAFADAALLPFKAAGYRFENSVCLSKPYGSENSGPEWSIETVAPSITPAIH